MLIVEYPVVQSIAMALGLIIIALEYPLPIFKPWSIYRSFILRIVLLSLQFFFGTLYYQVRECGLHISMSLNIPESRVRILQSGHW
jgi:hypothetical protein